MGLPEQGPRERQSEEPTRLSRPISSQTALAKSKETGYQVHSRIVSEKGCGAAATATWQKVALAYGVDRRNGRHVCLVGHPGSSELNQHPWQARQGLGLGLSPGMGPTLLA